MSRSCLLEVSSSSSDETCRWVLTIDDAGPMAEAEAEAGHERSGTIVMCWGGGCLYFSDFGSLCYALHLV